ncbi:12680_t:CDS:2 [Entrophospora sp. SA101]|nr:8109_t:CDS:2 [Entrophospora sp. SA101]CAJ0758378.1 12680_t:CDS:2 [Entrophospora sp. SA101]
MQENQKFIPRLLTDLKKLYHGDVEGDVLIKVGKEPDEVKEYQVHSFLMKARSNYFNAALSNKWNETTIPINNDDGENAQGGNTKDAKIVFKKPNIKPKIFDALFSRLLPESVDTRFFQKSTTGPMFGNHDLYISDECNSNYLSMHKRENYARRIREHGHFLVEDYEVFKVTKKI